MKGSNPGLDTSGKAARSDTGKKPGDEWCILKVYLEHLSIPFDGVMIEFTY